MAHVQRTEVATRLARIEGHLHAVHRMVDEGRDYPEIVRQITAVRSSLEAVVQVIVDDVVARCADSTGRKGAIDSLVRELREVVASAL
ncbi:MAG: metal-sensing transcriptional repressor [Thermoplasmata archaeon]|jgi:CsoR family transcriptional regulator, copper-sensing transcriptional repressor